MWGQENNMELTCHNRELNVKKTNLWEDRGLVNCTVCTYKSSSGGGSKNKNALGLTHKKFSTCQCMYLYL